jgi:hypothetical protein
MHRVLAVFGIASLGFLASVEAATPQSLTAANFESLRTLIKPHAGEDKWAEIPWLTDLWEARKRAAAEGKPILLWEMDGHPLGCT